jgi:hypothetical protein
VVEEIVEVVVVSCGVLMLLSSQDVSRPAYKRGKRRGRPAEGLPEPSCKPQLNIVRQ